MDELEEQLKRRDKRFVIRMVLRLAIVLLGGVYFMLWLSEQNVGGCAARGFGTVTDTPVETPAD